MSHTDNERNRLDDIDPDEPSNIRSLLAIELTQAAPQSCRENDAAFINMVSILVEMPRISEHLAHVLHK